MPRDADIAYCGVKEGPTTANPRLEKALCILDLLTEEAPHNTSVMERMKRNELFSRGSGMRHPKMCDCCLLGNRNLDFFGLICSEQVHCWKPYPFTPRPFVVWEKDYVAGWWWSSENLLYEWPWWKCDSWQPLPKQWLLPLTGSIPSFPACLDRTWRQPCLYALRLSWPEGFLHGKLEQNKLHRAQNK